MTEIKKLTSLFVNFYVIRGEKTILFDTGAFLSPDQMKALLEENGIDPKEIELIVIGHGHYDHCMLAKAWKEMTGAKILCHKNAADYMRTGKKVPMFEYNQRAKDYQPLKWMIGMFNIPPTQMLTYQPYIDFMDSTTPPCIDTIEPDILIGDEDYDLHPYGIPGKLIYTPGHADSSITLVTDDRIAFSGDNVLDLHVIQCLECIYPKGTYSLNWINYDEELLAASVRKVLEYADTWYGGHGEPLTREMIEPIVK